ncbi:alpha/beta fold hydrolase [Chloroflexota bacterium]
MNGEDYKQIDRHKDYPWPVERVLSRLIILTLALAGMGTAYQVIASALDKRKYPPPGKRVDIGGYRLHIHCIGEGQPTVVLDSGYGCIGLDWSLVQPEVAKLTRVCSYDRAGYGWSDASPKPRTPQQIVEELRRLLAISGIEGPHILVGHSLGGLYMQYFARRYPDEVSGVVLIDSSHPDLYQRLPLTARRQGDNWRKKRWLASQLGLLRLGVLSGLVESETPEKLPSEVQRVITALWLRSSFWRAVIGEGKALNKDISEVFRATGSFPNVPLFVLTSPDTEWLSDIGPDFPAFWQQAQIELASLSPSGRLIIAEQSGHMILHDQPDLVIDTIRQAIEMARCQ